MQQTYLDQLGREVRIKKFPERIISVVPSQTELLFDLGLDERVAGITKFCIHPESWFSTKTRVGGTKNLNMNKIRALNPDLILANKEENMRGELEMLAAEFPVWISDIKTLPEALDMIQQVGLITGTREMSQSIVNTIQQQFNELAVQAKAKRALYLIWQHPFMAVNNSTFIHDMMTRAGFENATAGYENRYPEITVQEIQRLNPELLLLSSEPFPFAEKHIEDFRVLLPDSEILLVDGELFSWYGSRLIKAPAYFSAL